MSKSDTENIQKQEISDEKIERLIQTEEKISKRYKEDEIHKGIITDIRTKKDIIELEIYLSDREEYKYTNYSLSNKKSVDKFLDTIDANISDISTIIGSEVKIYSRNGTKRWYLLMTNKKIKYIQKSKLFNLTESKYSKKVSIIYSSLISVILFGLLCMLFLQLFIPILQLGIMIGTLVSLCYPIITSYILEFYYNLNSEQIHNTSLFNQ